MNIETGEIISGTHSDFKRLFNNGQLMSIDGSNRTTVEKLKNHIDIGNIGLSKNEKKRRRKALRIK